MLDTDWREILNFSQKELLQADKEKLCESLSWMDVDDVELNFTDLKTLFRLSQDILKHKSEEVNNLLGQLKTSQKKSKKKTIGQSPTKKYERLLQTTAKQEEEIKANKDILQQLYDEIAELEGRKKKLGENKQDFEKESESSRGTLSEMNAVIELENELAMKNKHIRKLLSDLKVIEDENSSLKEKITLLKDKLTEATQIINTLTEQLVCLKNESTQLKDMIGQLEQEKIQLSISAEDLRKQLFDKESSRENIYEEIKAKVQQWKIVAKTKKAESEALLAENDKLKEDLKNIGKSSLPEVSAYAKYLTFSV
ncbi:hypothetical protein K1T71_005603 [Dendrolimus kikuchii]|uniref:Uncharacterized protein n=1 Tax=Dendrolimus kikuchii TaxID=765133 RepID=A0ACC1D5F6_9NEOP|nr:hypothetical protein K1T71_005603 [Dendrolimus kikuchii]